jgi:hypothetical protein
MVDLNRECYKRSKQWQAVSRWKVLGPACGYMLTAGQLSSKKTYITVP